MSVLSREVMDQARRKRRATRSEPIPLKGEPLHIPNKLKFDEYHSFKEWSDLLSKCDPQHSIVSSFCTSCLQYIDVTEIARGIVPIRMCCKMRAYFDQVDYISANVQIEQDHINLDLRSKSEVLPVQVLDVIDFVGNMISGQIDE